jgi:hypothetical protein
MTLSAIIFALQMMFGAANVTPAQIDNAVSQAQQGGVYQTPPAGIIVVGDTLETN